VKVPLNGDDYELGVSSFEPFGGSDNQKFEISETQKHIFYHKMAILHWTWWGDMEMPSCEAFQ